MAAQHLPRDLQCGQAVDSNNSLKQRRRTHNLSISKINLDSSKIFPAFSCATIDLLQVYFKPVVINLFLLMDHLF